METASKLLLIAVGGAFGAVARYLINVSPLNNIFQSFPFPTFFINVAGSFLIGFFLILLTDKFTVSDNVRLSIMVGFLGAFTTFSTFELELWELMKENQYFTAFSYLFLSVAAGFTGIVAGITLARKL